jgi:hypothetical protein
MEKQSVKMNYLTENYFITYCSSFSVLNSPHHSKLLAETHNVHIILGFVTGKSNDAIRTIASIEPALEQL